MSDSQAPSLLVARIVSAAMMGSVAVYVVVAFVVAPGQTPSEDASMLPLALGAAAAVSLLSIPALRTMTMGSLALLPGPALQRPRLSPEDRAVAMRRYFTGTIVGLALAESVAVLGLVLAMLTADPLAILPFAVVSLAAMAVQFPREACLGLVRSREEAAGG